ncbi:hypothetical protein Tco_1380011 [Tanacetum coccineum]
MITNNNRIEGKKLSGLMLSPQLKTLGYLTRNCRNKGPATGSNLQPVSVIVIPVEKKCITETSTQRQTTVPMEEHTC